MNKLKTALPVAAQTVGSGVAMYGVFLGVGLVWTLIIGGVALVAVGTLAEVKGGH